MKKAFKVLYLFFLLTAIGCTSDFDAFEEKASEYAKSENKINNEELIDLTAIVSEFLDQNDRAFKRFLTNESFDEQKLIAYLENKGFKVEKTPVVSAKNVAVNVYIENSGSMHGYVNGDSDFKNAITELIVRLNQNYNPENIRLNFINSEIYPIDTKESSSKYPTSLTSQKMMVGDITKSDLNDIFEETLSKTIKDTISILISDCIYSISGNNTGGKLEIQKSLTKEVFQRSFKKDKNKSIIVAQLISGFSGYYYTKNNSKIKLKDEIRPYYFTVMGNSEQIINFDKNINLQEIKGYENKLVLSSKDYSKGIYFSVVNAKNDLGKFKPARDFSDKNSIKGIEDVESDLRSGDKFTLSVALDLSELPLEKSYMTDPKNYTIDEGDFIISKISEFNKEELASSSVSRISKSGKYPTHYITFSATSNKYSDLKFNLKRQLPKWVEETSTEDDTNIKSIGSKTFGFKYLIEGISEAYQTSSPSKNYFEIKIKINK